MGNNDASADQNIDLKKSARRRLVGAIALALFTIIVLPMVMEREPKPPSQDIQVRIPGQKSLLSPLEPPSGVVLSAPQSASSVARQVASQPSGTTPTENPERSVAEMHVASADLQTTSVDKSADTPKAAPEKLIVEKSRGTSAVSLSSGNVDQWLVRLGAYQNAANVRVLINKTKEMGLPAYSEKVDSAAGLRIRVFAGPFPSHEAAEKAQSRIKKIGVDGTVVAKP